jgi:lipoprotein-anchoring transpeptidase ErfK/SrfK
MTRRLLALPVALLLALIALPAVASADDRVIAAGVSAGGVDLGGQTIDTAVATLQLGVGAKAERAVTVRSAGRTFTLTAKDAGVRFDAETTAKRAYYAGRDQGPNVTVPLALTASKRAVAAFTATVDRAVSRAPRNATLRIGLKRMDLTRSRKGRTINEHELARRIDRALVDPERRRAFRATLKVDKPAITAAVLRRRNGTILTVDRSTRKLRLFKQLRLRKTYGVAVGAAGYDTPAGLFNIQSRQVNPSWTAPNRPWAGAMAGRTVPGGAPGNPLKARWLGVNGAVGIHGTAEEWSIGSRASHGCIRMRVSDVIELYRRVPVGTPVLIR